MKITVLCVGKIKENYFAAAVAEYTKRLSRYATIQIVEVPDEKTPDGASAAEEAQILRTEGGRLMKHMQNDAYRIVLAIDGEAVDSVQLSEKLEKIAVSGNGHIQFIIGGSLGLSSEVQQKANWRLSFSKLTFPHQLMRVVLLEQIYRAFRIRNNEPYHK